MEHLPLSTYIREDIRKELNSAINEEMGINIDVSRTLETIINEFRKHLNEKKYIKVNNNLYIKTVSFKYNCFGIIVKFVFNCYNIIPKEYYETYSQKLKIGNGETDETNLIVNINVGLINGTLQQFSNVLRHELEHVFQITKGRKINNLNKGVDGKKFYKKAQYILKNKDYYSKNEFIVSFLIYTLSDSEVDGFINQLYQEIIEAPLSDETKIISKSSAYIYYLKDKNFFNLLKNKKEDFDNIINSFGFTFDNFIKFVERNLSRMITKIGKVIVQAENYKEENETVNISFNNL